VGQEGPPLVKGKGGAGSILAATARGSDEGHGGRRALNVVLGLGARGQVAAAMACHSSAMALAPPRYVSAEIV
jgi:hypothetical protein